MSKPPEETERLKKMVQDYSGEGSPNRVKFLELINKGYERTERISQQTFNRIFNLDTRTNKWPEIPVSVLRAIAMSTDYNIAWLLTGTGSMKMQKTDTKTPSSADAKKGVKNLEDSENIMLMLSRIEDKQNALLTNLTTISGQVETVKETLQGGPLLSALEEKVEKLRSEISKPGYGHRNPSKAKEETRKS